MNMKICFEIKIYLFYTKILKYLSVREKATPKFS